MQVVTIKPLQHRGNECIGLYFKKNLLLQQSIQKEAGARWSKTNTCWYIPCDGEKYIRLKAALEDKARVDATGLKEFLLDKKRKGAAADVIQQKEIIKIYEKNAIREKPAQAVNSYNFPTNLAPENLKALNLFKRQLGLKSYSPSTIRTYSNEFAQFLSTIKSKPAADFTEERIKDYLQYCFEKLKLSENTLHSKINALKFYYEQVPYCWIFYGITFLLINRVREFSCLNQNKPMKPILRVRFSKYFRTQEQSRYKKRSGHSQPAS